MIHLLTPFLLYTGVQLVSPLAINTKCAAGSVPGSVVVACVSDAHPERTSLRRLPFAFDSVSRSREHFSSGQIA